MLNSKKSNDECVFKARIWGIFILIDFHLFSKIFVVSSFGIVMKDLMQKTILNPFFVVLLELIHMSTRLIKAQGICKTIVNAN